MSNTVVPAGDAALRSVHAGHFPGNKPACACGEYGLVRPDALVEIATITHIGKA